MNYLKKSIFMMMTLCLMLISVNTNTFAQNTDYEKYGKIAMSVVKNDYPSEEVTDYKYAGRTKLSATTVLDTFEFKVKENGKEVTVLVKVAHDTSNNKTLTITVEEKP